MYRLSLPALLSLLVTSPAMAARPVVRIDTPMVPPQWALLERELLRANTDACRVFFERYYDERGFLRCVERWGGDDGPDDAAECVADWPLLYALGADDDVRRMYRRAWEGHLRQYTQAKTTEVPFARDGMYYKEFPVKFDWLHNAEGLRVFNLINLCEPGDPRYRRRVRRYAGFYDGSDPGAPNYDPEHRVIRSMINGSRGPLLRKATALDWAGDPIEVKHRFELGHGEQSYEEMLAHFEEYNDVVGDHPLNLLSTTLALNAYTSTGDEKHRRWLLEYVGAWRERMIANGHVIPSNVGRDGTIGGDADGKWYGGTYGWGFTVTDTRTGKPAHRNSTSWAFVGFANAYLLTGDDAWLEPWRKMIDTINAESKTVDGRKVYPRMYGDDGWYDFVPSPYSENALELWYLSMRDEDAARVARHPWLRYLSGLDRGPGNVVLRPAGSWPAASLGRDLNRVRTRVAAIRADETTPDTRLADDPMRLNPASVESLVSLMLGGLKPGRQASVLHARLRYFDPQRRRPGIPPDVAALVDELTSETTGVTLVNVSQTEPRIVLVQAGAYGEHEFVDVTQGDETTQVGGNLVEVRLGPGCGARLTFGNRRYVNPPTDRFPWNGR